MNAGLFITFEGPDGSGKSTQRHRLVAWLRRRGLTVSETREPGGTPLGDRLRELILDLNSPTATPLAMALLYSASRAQLVESVIRPTLEAGHVVVADRYVDSTLAYQGYGFGLDEEALRSLNCFATGGLQPDVTIYVDIPPDVGAARRRDRGEEDRLDSGSRAFHERVRAGYRQLIDRDPSRWIEIDGNTSPEAVERAIIEVIEPRLEEVTRTR